VADGLRIRELPDGGKEFVLDHPDLDAVRIDDRAGLQFGATDVVIGVPFTLELDGGIHALDPRRPDGLGPLAGLYPGSVRWLWATGDAQLVAVFDGGATVVVEPDASRPAWSVGDVYCPPGGTG